ncbi:MAG TPA: hypothetical protein VEI97_04740 [bacterium]|nr:hypothetical protein [bacterium]
MADQNQELEPYIPDPKELQRAYWIIAGIIFLAALFIGATIETVVRHGNPLDILFKTSGGGAAPGGH